MPKTRGTWWFRATMDKKMPPNETTRGNIAFENSVFFSKNILKFSKDKKMKIFKSAETPKNHII